MRIVQTFWTAGRNPLEYSFGWLHPEYNLMSWSLSCLSLREHYDEVALYTDTRGKEVLIDLLHLPYTEVHVVFDDFPCLPQHWALSKIKTYSLQDKPFLHVDGDVYLPKPIDPAILEAPLVAQNREIGTGYYRQMMDELLFHEELIIPDYVKECASRDIVPSYNMGVFGGCDIESIHAFCQEVMMFMGRNRMNDPKCSNSGIYCNVFMEQIWFAAWAEEYKKEVRSLIDHPVKDNGYTIHEFCNLDRYGSVPCFHLLGGHKSNREVIPMLERAVIRLYPNVYRKVLSLFPEKNHRLNTEGRQQPNWLSAEKCLAQYEDFLSEQVERWKELDPETLFLQEQQAAQSIRFWELTDEERNNCTLQLNPHLALFEMPPDWHPWARRQLQERLSKEGRRQFNVIAVTPSFSDEGIRETAIPEVAKVIIKLLSDKITNYKEIQDRIYKIFKVLLIGNTSSPFYKELKEIIFKNVIIINNTNK